MFQHPDPLVTHIHLFLKTHVTRTAATADNSGVWRSLLALLPPTLSDSFNPVAAYTHSQPALLLQKEHGLQDIGAVYRMPHGLDVKMVEAYCLANRWLRHEGRIATSVAHMHLLDVVDRLILMNPPLARLRFDRDRYDHCHDVILGATSGFNAHDIQFFLDGNFGYVALANPVYAAKNNAACAVLGIESFNWVPAPHTLDQIITRRTGRR